MTVRCAHASGRGSAGPDCSFGDAGPDVGGRGDPSSGGGAASTEYAQARVAALPARSAAVRSTVLTPGVAVSTATAAVAATGPEVASPTAAVSVAVSPTRYTGGAGQAIVGGVTSRRIVTVSARVPPTLSAVQVNVTARVSAVTRCGPQPVAVRLAGVSGSATAHVSSTSPTW